MSKRHGNQKYTSVVKCGTKIFPEYQQWSSMRRRCRKNSVTALQLPTYKDCHYSPEWESFETWLEWARQQVGFLNKDTNGKVWHLDKDVVVLGNKVYSADTCVFLPHQLNTFFVPNESVAGGLPVGVTSHPSGGGFRARITTRSSKSTSLGVHGSAEAAHAAYREAKLCEAKYLASVYEGKVDDRVIQSLLTYEQRLNINY